MLLGLLALLRQIHDFRVCTSFERAGNDSRAWLISTPLEGPVRPCPPQHIKDEGLRRTRGEEGPSPPLPFLGRSSTLAKHHLESRKLRRFPRRSEED